MTDYNSGSNAASHLVVLVHGLWGNPSHMESISKALREQYSEDDVSILIPKSNKGTFTYDGIETGGERTCREIEDEIAAIKAKGGNVTKLSVVGYSMGGLTARYAIGLLYAKGVLDKLECMNFTAFASPFLGTRSPLKGFMNHLFNGIGARTLSKSGRQLFLLDKFRDTGRPLLAVLADPKSIFMQGLAKFRRRTLYANVINDRTAVFYTTGISKTDPYADMSRVKVRYAKGYESVVLNPSDPFTHIMPEMPEKDTLGSSTKKLLKQLPLILRFMVFLPIGMTALFSTAAYQSFHSARRIKQHEDGLAGIDVSKYRVPLWMKGIQGQVDGAYESMGSAQDQDYLGSSDSEGDDDSDRIISIEKKQSHPQQPTLALASEQFAMIQALDDLGWRKYPVWIQNVSHSHAAIVVRWETDRFAEGKKVIGHWAKEEFLA